MSKKRHRKFMVQTDVVHPETGEEILTEETLCTVLGEKNLKSWAYILHDKDVTQNEDGTETKRAPHWHIILWLENANTYSAVSKWFDLAENFVESVKVSWGAMVTYLTHELVPDKHRYSDEEIKAKFGYDWEADRDRYLESQNENITAEELNELLRMCADGTIREYDHHKHIPPLIYIKNEKKFKIAFNYFMENVSWNRKNPKRVMFFAGLSGTGKTHLAKQLAEEQNEEPFITSAGADVMDGYRGERVIIFDEFRGDNWNVEQLLKLTDPYTDSKAWSRFKSKSLAAADVIMFTFRSKEDFDTVDRIIHRPKELDEFFNYFKGSHNEPKTQWYRRVEVFTRVVNKELPNGWNEKTAYYYVKANPDSGNFEDWALAGTTEDLYQSLKEEMNTTDWLGEMGVNVQNKMPLPDDWRDEIEEEYEENEAKAEVESDPAVPF